MGRREGITTMRHVDYEAFGLWAYMGGSYVNPRMDI